MSGKENKETVSTCSRLSSIPRRSVSSPFSSSSKKAASSGVRLPSPARKSIKIPLISQSPSAWFPQVRNSISESTSVLKENNVPKVLGCNIKPEAVDPAKVLAVKSLTKKTENASKVENKPLKPQPFAVKKTTQMEPASNVKPKAEEIEHGKTVMWSNNLG